VIQVSVRPGNFAQAVRDLKRKMQRELIFKMLKDTRFFRPPSVKKVEEQQESERRMRKMRRRRDDD
jgi:small subunit ribosomal protein S21